MMPIVGLLVDLYAKVRIKLKWSHRINLKILQKTITTINLRYVLFFQTVLYRLSWTEPTNQKSLSEKTCNEWKDFVINNRRSSITNMNKSVSTNSKKRNLAIWDKNSIGINKEKGSFEKDVYLTTLNSLFHIVLVYAKNCLGCVQKILRRILKNFEKCGGV